MTPCRFTARRFRSVRIGFLPQAFQLIKEVEAPPIPKFGDLMGFSGIKAVRTSSWDGDGAVHPIELTS